MTEHRPDGGPRRHRTRAQERIEALEAEMSAAGRNANPQDPATPGAAGIESPVETPAATLAQDVAQLQGELEAARTEARDMRAAWQRSAADFANYKRRSEQERERALGMASEMLLLKLLAVVDDYDRALATMPPELGGLVWIEGLWLVERKLRALLESEGVTPIEAVGTPFDPREHEAAVHEQTSAAADGTVIGELQRGYRIRDRVLRPALVKVANNAGRKPTPGGNH